MNIIANFIFSIVVVINITIVCVNRVDRSFLYEERNISLDSVDFTEFTFNSLPILTNLEAFLEKYGKPKIVKMRNGKFINDIKDFNGAKTRDKFYPYALFIVENHNQQIGYRFEPNDIVYLTELSFAGNEKIKLKYKGITISYQTILKELRHKFPDSYKNRNNIPSPFVIEDGDNRSYDYIKLVHCKPIDENEILSMYIKFINNRISELYITNTFH